MKDILMRIDQLDSNYAPTDNMLHVRNSILPFYFHSAAGMSISSLRVNIALFLSFYVSFIHFSFY